MKAYRTDIDVFLDELNGKLLIWKILYCIFFGLVTWLLIHFGGFEEIYKQITSPEVKYFNIILCFTPYMIITWAYLIITNAIKHYYLSIEGYQLIEKYRDL